MKAGRKKQKESIKNQFGKENKITMIKHHKQHDEILDFLEAASDWTDPIKLDDCSTVVDVAKFCESMRDILKYSCSKRQYNLAIEHTRKLKNQIS